MTVDTVQNCRQSCHTTEATYLSVLSGGGNVQNIVVEAQDRRWKAGPDCTRQGPDTEPGKGGWASLLIAAMRAGSETVVCVVKLEEQQ